MTRYKLARRVAVVLSGLGWVFVGISVLYFGLMVFVTAASMWGSGSVVFPSMVQLPMFVMSGIPMLALALLLVLVGHVARAVFDMADASVPGKMD
ncbi:MAG: hypothetical protein ACXIUL_10225 [Wenzhouxiangella sp.]